MNQELEFSELSTREIDSIDDAADLVVSALDGNSVDKTIAALEAAMPLMEAQGFKLFRRTRTSSSSMTIGSQEILFVEDVTNSRNRVFLTVLVQSPFRVLSISREEPELDPEPEKQPTVAGVDWAKV